MSALAVAAPRYPIFWPLAHTSNLSLDGVFLSLGLRYDTILAPKIRPLFWYGAQKEKFGSDDPAISATFCHRHFSGRLGTLLCLTMQKT